MKRPVIPIILAIVLAIGAGAAVYLYARGTENRVLEQQQAAPALLSEAAIPRGTALVEAQADGLVSTTQIPLDLRPADALSGVTTANGDLVALADIPAGQILLATGFGPEPEQVAALPVPDGMLAVTVQLEDPSKVGAFLRPGSEVAVFNTSARQTDDTGQPILFTTRPLLDRVTVLAVGSSGEAQEATAPPEEWAARLVTVAVDQPQAEQLIHASHTGVLTMALLSETTTVKPSAGVTNADLVTMGGAS